MASNKYQAATEHIVTRFFPGIFDVILGEREGIERKPDPQIVYDIRAQLPGEALYVGDSLVDMQTAGNAKMPFVACSWGFVAKNKLIEAGANPVIDAPGDLLRCIASQKNSSN